MKKNNDTKTVAFLCKATILALTTGVAYEGIKGRPLALVLLAAATLGLHELGKEDRTVATAGQKVRKELGILSAQSMFSNMRNNIVTGATIVADGVEKGIDALLK